MGSRLLSKLQMMALLSNGRQESNLHLSANAYKDL